MQKNFATLESIPMTESTTKNKLHRVTLYREQIASTSMYSVYEDGVSSSKPSSMQLVCENYKRTPEAAWAKQSLVDIRVAQNPWKWAHAMEVSVYCDLNDRQYAEYLLRGLYIE